MHVDVCAVAVTVFVVDIVVVVDMVSAVVVDCLVCVWWLLCVHCNEFNVIVLLLIAPILWFFIY